MNSESVFRYSYSAKQNEEVQTIRSKYLPKTESKLEELKCLDRCVCSAGVTRSLVVGILGCLIFGLGLCLAMGVIGKSVALGVFVGVWGLAGMLAAYPVQRVCFRAAKAKHSPRTLELTEELTRETI